MKSMITLAIFALSSFSFADNQEQLLGVRVNSRGISFQVRSNGCTEKAHFQFTVEERMESMGPMLPALEPHHYITATRISPDDCEVMLPYGTEVLTTFDELGITFGKFHITNPIGGDKIMTRQ